MSFSSVTKDELARRVETRPCCQLAELTALVRINGTLQISSQHRLELNIVTENAAVARKIFILFKKLFNVQAMLLAIRQTRLKKGNRYLIKIPAEAEIKQILIRLGMLNQRGLLAESFNEEMVRQECCRRAYLRGVFLGGGSVNNPERPYHLEIVTSREKHAKGICRLMGKFHLSPGISQRKGGYVVYLKESEQIVSFFNIICAYNALLDFENVRIYRGMRNQVNRLVNCETANLNKTINAALRQIENVLYIAEAMSLNKLPPALRETANLRLKNPDVSLKELGQLMDPPIGKSGLSHRMRKLESIANKLKAKDNAEQNGLH